MKEKKTIDHSSKETKKVIEKNGFNMHLSEIEIELNKVDEKENDSLINPDDIYNKGLEDL